MSKINGNGISDGSSGEDEEPSPASPPSQERLIRCREFTIQHFRQGESDTVEHSHDHTELGLLFSSGIGALSYRGPSGDLCQSRLVGPQLYMVPPGTLHVSRWETQAELLVGHVEESFWRRLEEPISTRAIAVEANVGASRDVPLWQLVSTLLDLWKESGPASERGAKMVAEALISREIQLLSQIPVASRKNVGSLSPNRLRLIDEYVDKHLRYEIHVPDLAKLVGFSVAHLTTVLKNTIGLAPYEYITRCRMHKARLLLLTGEYRLREVANAVGYNDPEHFSWKFKNFFNYPPRFLLRYGHG